MHIFACLTDGLFTDTAQEVDFLAKLAQATGASTSRTEGCTESVRTVIITVFEAPKHANEQFPQTGPHGPLGSIAHTAHTLLGDKVDKVTVMDPSGYHLKYEIRTGPAAIAS